MGGRALDAVDAGQPLMDETGDLVEVVGRDDDQQVVAAGHQVAALDLLEGGDALGDGVETADAFGADLDLDHGAHAVLGLETRIEHGAHAQEDALLAQGRQLAVHGFGAEAEDAADLGGIEGFPVEDELEYGVHGEVQEAGRARRARTAAARPSSTGTVCSKEMQASVMLQP